MNCRASLPKSIYKMLDNQCLILSANCRSSCYPALTCNDLFGAASGKTLLSFDSAKFLLQDRQDGFEADLSLQPISSINESLNIIKIMPCIVPFNDFRLARRSCIF